jgi:hypothetical protein
MGIVTNKQLMIGGAALVGVLLVYVARRGAGGIAQDAGRVIGNAAGGAAVGVINGVSDAVGIPVPERTACDAAKASGNTWAASWDCPIGEFVRYLSGSDTQQEPEVVTQNSVGWNSYDQQQLMMQGASGQQ